MDGLTETWFRLSPNGGGVGVSCGIDGVFVGQVALLKQAPAPDGSAQWQPRSLSEVNDELSECFALPVEFARKMECLSAVARALSRGDIVLAQIATLQLQIPDPPPLSKSIRSDEQIRETARQLQRGGILKAGWDSAKHPRWPAGSPDSIGGQFSPADTTGTESVSAPPVSPAQLTIPAPGIPFRLPLPIPRPFEIVPPPLDIPNTFPRDTPMNPYPDRAGCDEEWAEAVKYCLDLKTRGQLGRGASRGMGKTFLKCVKGQVSARCGGNALGA